MLTERGGKKQELWVSLALACLQRLVCLSLQSQNPSLWPHPPRPSLLEILPLPLPRAVPGPASQADTGNEKKSTKFCQGSTGASFPTGRARHMRDNGKGGGRRDSETPCDLGQQVPMYNQEERPLLTSQSHGDVSGSGCRSTRCVSWETSGFQIVAYDSVAGDGC